MFYSCLKPDFIHIATFIVSDETKRYWGICYYIYLIILQKYNELLYSE